MTTYWIHSMPTGMDLDEQRPCARGEHCVSATVVVEGGERVRRPALGPRAFCEADRKVVLEAIGALPGHYRELAGRLGDKTVSDGPRVSGGGKTAPIPVNDAVDALMVEIVHVAVSWHRRVAAIPQLKLTPILGTPERRGSEVAAPILETVCERLGAHLDALVSLPAEPMDRWISEKEAAEYVRDLVVEVEEYRWLLTHCRIQVHSPGGLVEMQKHLSGADGGLELLSLEHRCRRMLGWTAQHQNLPVPCWGCGLRTVRRWDGGAGLEDRAECVECREQYEGERFGLLMGEVAQHEAAKARRAS